MPRGAKPDLNLRQQAIELHRQGLSLWQIARRLHTSRQRIHHTLRKAGVDTSTAGVPLRLLCYRCRKPVNDRVIFLRNNGRVPCLACLKQMPKARFGIRIKAYRVAAGLSQQELAEAAGISLGHLAHYEQTRDVPPWRTLGKLVVVLGVGLLVVEKTKS